MPQSYYKVSAANQTLSVPSADFSAQTAPILQGFAILGGFSVLSFAPNAGESGADFATRLSAELNSLLSSVTGLDSASTITVTHTDNGATQDFLIETDNVDPRVIEIESTFISQTQVDTQPNYSNGSLCFNFLENASASRYKTAAYNHTHTIGLGCDTAVNCKQTYPEYLRKNMGFGK